MIGKKENQKRDLRLCFSICVFNNLISFSMSLAYPVKEQTPVINGIQENYMSNSLTPFRNYTDNHKKTVGHQNMNPCHQFHSCIGVSSNIYFVIFHPFLTILRYCCLNLDVTELNAFDFKVCLGKAFSQNNTISSLKICRTNSPLHRKIKY